mmetsp:Transcript_3912/g.9220  ORF Transcript_3912/g.9220 Transcript_3912/m.9220 type:complete len:209 (+) Transcript_3912:179-805(+)
MLRASRRVTILGSTRLHKPRQKSSSPWSAGSELGSCLSHLRHHLRHSRKRGPGEILWISCALRIRGLWLAWRAPRLKTQLRRRRRQCKKPSSSILVLWLWQRGLLHQPKLRQAKGRHLPGMMRDWRAVMPAARDICSQCKLPSRSSEMTRCQRRGTPQWHRRRSSRPGCSGGMGLLLVSLLVQLLPRQVTFLVGLQQSLKLYQDEHHW